MFFPIKIRSQDDSLFIFTFNIPVFAAFREGFKPENIVSVGPFTAMSGQKANCLHVYVLGLYWRCRSKETMARPDLFDKHKRFIFSVHKGWQQVFESGVI